MDMLITGWQPGCSSGPALEGLFGSKEDKKSFGSLQGNPCRIQWVSAHMSPGLLSVNS